MSGSTSIMNDRDLQAECVPSLALDSVLKTSQDHTLCNNATRVRGYDFEGDLDYEKLIDSFAGVGYQASHLAQAMNLINMMLTERCQKFDKEIDIDDVFVSRRSGCTIFLGYTSNMISSGLRESIRFLVKNSLVDCIVTTAGGVEEDLIKCLKRPSDDNLKCDTFVGEFSLQGSVLRDMGINRIGNLLVPNQNYCAFEDWVLPILDSMLEKQKNDGFNWTPSKIIERLGEEINDEDSVCYWAAKNKIPIFCPAITDGSLGDMIFFHTFRNPGLKIDIVSDIRRLPTVALRARKSGVIILGGGICKHHILNANLMRGGAEYSVYVNTANEFDGSDAGALPDEAISWGKLKTDAEAVKVCADASIVFPLIVAKTFKKYLDNLSINTMRCD